jgi:hypothetical protein
MRFFLVNALLQRFHLLCWKALYAGKTDECEEVIAARKNSAI